MLAAEAIADPVRRRILELLARGPVPAGALAGHFEISRPAISRHLRVLRECGLVRDTLVGRRRFYSVDPAPLRELVRWIDQFQQVTWDQRFDALETEVARTRRDTRRQSASRPEHPGNTAFENTAFENTAFENTEEIA